MKKIHWPEVNLILSRLKQLCRSPLLINLQLKRDSGSGGFRVNFKKFLRAVYLQSTIPIQMSTAEILQTILQANHHSAKHSL